MNTRRRQASRQGFSMAEVLISLAILGVGLTMSAALFPTGVKEFERATTATIGSMVAEAGLGMAKSKLRYAGGNTLKGVTTGNTKPIEDTLTPINELFTADELRYLADPDDETLGYIIYARQVTDDSNDFQIVVVSYDKDDENAAVNTYAVRLNNYHSVSADRPDYTLLYVCSPGSTSREKDPEELKKVKIGTPVVNASNGAFCRVVEIKTTSVVVRVDRVPEFSEDDYGDGGDSRMFTGYVFTEDGDDRAPLSPGMTVMATRTALRPVEN